jgi:lipoprotein NlpD
MAEPKRWWLHAGAVFACAASLVFAGCASKPNRAPVEERTPVARSAMPAASAPTDAPLPASAASAPAVEAEGAKPPNENAGKPGYYVVKPGDTMIRIGLDSGQNWRDLVKWNNLENPNVIEVGQVLRVVPPGVDPAAPASRPVTTARVESKPLTAPAPGAPASTGGVPTTTAAAPSGATVVSTSPPAAHEGDDDIRWGWPAGGTVIAGFDEGKNKGLAIAGKAGDPVLAAADGRVVYAGSGLRGYGNLVILKHNATYLTAYAHNQTLLVKEDQNVKRGQKIAEMGSTDADSVQLHFEIRKQGRPIDPVKLLPPR